MTISDDLFQLIKSLKQTEKRYFKIFATIHVKGEQNNYVKLFDAIDRQKEYDEKSLLLEFKGEKFVKQFAVTKNYLYNFILRSLRAYYSGFDAESKIQEEVESVKILFGKGMYKKCIKIINKTKQLAKKFDKFELMLHLIKWENEINTRFLAGDKLDEFRTESNDEIRDVLTIMEEKYQLRLLEQEAFRVYRKHTRARSDEDLEKIQEILAHPALAEGALPRSFIGKLRYYNVKGVYYTLMEKHEESHRYDLLRYRLFEEQPEFITENLIQYIKVQNNLLHNYKEMEQWEKFEEVLIKVREITEDHATTITNTEQAIIFETSYVQELAHYYRTRQFDKGINMIPKVELMLERYESVIVIEFKIDILFTIAKLFYYSGDLDNASDWVNKIVADERPNAADDIFCFVRILNLLIHFDLGNYEFLKYEIKSTRRFLAKKKRLFKLEELVLRYMNKLVNQVDEQKRKTIFMKFSQELDDTLKQAYEENALSFLNLQKWLQSKIEERPLRDIMMQDDSTTVKN